MIFNQQINLSSFIIKLKYYFDSIITIINFIVNSNLYFNFVKSYYFDSIIIIINFIVNSNLYFIKDYYFDLSVIIINFIIDDDHYLYFIKH